MCDVDSTLVLVAMGESTISPPKIVIIVIIFLQLIYIG
jgi:hypothetical protein